MENKRRVYVGDLNDDFEIAKSEMQYTYWIRLQEHIRNVAYERFGEDWRRHVQNRPMTQNWDEALPNADMAH